MRRKNEGNRPSQTSKYGVFVQALIIIIALPACSQHSSISQSEEPDDLNTVTFNLIEEMGDRKVIILGERHHQPQSQRLMLALVKELLDQGERVFVGLEIPSDRQKDLERALSRQPHLKPLARGITDHPGYREMLRELDRIMSSGAQLTIAAIDAGSDEGDRDGAMHVRVMDALATGKFDRFLNLVGNIHALKNMKWPIEAPRKEMPGLAKKLARDVEIYCIYQMFREGQGGPSFINTKTPEGASVAMKGVDYLKCASEMRGEDVADAVILWGDKSACEETAYGN